LERTFMVFTYINRFNKGRCYKNLQLFSCSASALAIKRQTPPNER
jgi:hypothetical protein